MRNVCERALLQPHPPAVDGAADAAASLLLYAAVLCGQLCGTCMRVTQSN